MTELTQKSLIQYGSKSVVMAGTYIAIDRFVLKRTSTTKSTLAAAASIVAGSLVAQVIADQFIAPNSAFGLMKNGKVVESQIAQVVASAATTTILDKYLLGNSYNKNVIDYRSIMMLIAADVISEVALDIVFQRKIDPFDNNA